MESTESASSDACFLTELINRIREHERFAHAAHVSAEQCHHASEKELWENTARDHRAEANRLREMVEELYGIEIASADRAGDTAETSNK
jgi:hypothetical protein